MDKKITVLIDNESWILPYAEKLVESLKQLNYQAQLARDYDDITEGWINFMIGCVKKTPMSVMEKNKFNMVVHESNLPQGKGFAPMTWQILENKKKIPFCLIEATDQVDSGDVWIKDYIELDGAELSPDWRLLQGEKTIELCMRFVKEFQFLHPEMQRGDESYYPRRTPKDSELDINKTISEQFNLLRVVDNDSYPAYFFLNERKYIIKIEKS